MQPLSTVKLAQAAPAQPLSAGRSVMTISGPLTSADTGLQVAILMDQTQALKPNQVLPEGTPDMFLEAWEKLVVKYGLETFKEGLSKANERTRFFPDPLDIAEQCEALASASGNRRRAVKAMSDLDEAKVKWLRDRAEAMAEGYQRKPLSPDLYMLAERLGLLTEGERLEGERHAA